MAWIERMMKYQALADAEMHYGVYLHCSVGEDHGFLPKKDMMLPCPGFAAPFFAFPLAAGAGVGLAFFGAGSSSENDSQAASSRVTAVC